MVFMVCTMHAPCSSSQGVCLLQDPTLLSPFPCTLGHLLHSASALISNPPPASGHSSQRNAEKRSTAQNANPKPPPHGLAQALQACATEEKAAWWPPKSKHTHTHTHTQTQTQTQTEEEKEMQLIIATARHPNGADGTHQWHCLCQ